MRKLYTTLLLEIICFISVGQIGIGTASPHSSAGLEISSSNKGLLLPRVALTGTADNTTIPAPATSLLVYNTAAKGTGSTAVTPGFYYWNSNKWLNFLNGSSPSNTWSMTGNSGTNAATNFIGTIDNVPLKFKVNNILSGQIDPVTGNTAFGFSTLFSNLNGTDNTALGMYALHNNTFGSSNTANGRNALYSNTTGNNNLALGRDVLYYNTAGSSNIAIGLRALFYNTTGNDNSANGSGALESNTTGGFNTAMGNYTLNGNTTGNYNTAIGTYALIVNPTGTLNTAIGYMANIFSGNENATAVGANAMARCNNCLVLGKDANVGIGTSNPTAKLDVNGDVNIDGNLVYSGMFGIGLTTLQQEFVATGGHHDPTQTYPITQWQLGCPVGYTLLGGGGGHKINNTAASDISVNYSGPDLANDNVWRLIITNNTDDDRGCIIYIKCGNVE